MPLNIQMLEFDDEGKVKEPMMWENNTGRRLFLSTDGRVVGGDDPNVQSVLVGPEGRLPMEDAIKYGLAQPVEAQVQEELNKTQEEASEEEKATTGEAVSNKAVKGPEKDK